MGLEVFAGIAAVGAIGSAVGSFSAASAQEDAAKKNLELKRAQADQLESWGRREEELARLKAEKAVGSISIDTGSASSLRELGDFYFQTEREILDMKEKVRFNASMLRKGADVEADLVSSMGAAKWWQAGGTILGGAGNIGLAYGHKTGSK